MSRVHRVATLAAAVGLALAVTATAQTRAPEEVFAAGNAAYEAGDFDAAVAEYLRLVAQGAVHRDLYYNLGNAYYRSGDLGRAVLYYERALRLTPRDDDVQANVDCKFCISTDAMAGKGRACSGTELSGLSGVRGRISFT